eukprot:9316103-Pyramimonas_sp.AAC.1
MVGTIRLPCRHDWDCALLRAKMMAVGVNSPIMGGHSGFVGMGADGPNWVGGMFCSASDGVWLIVFLY